MNIERGKRKRKCHNCYLTIPKGEAHMAIYRKSNFSWWSIRTNTCFICIEDGVRKIKKSIKGTIRNRRNKHMCELLLEKL